MCWFPGGEPGKYHPFVLLSISIRRCLFSKRMVHTCPILLVEEALLEAIHAVWITRQIPFFLIIKVNTNPTWPIRVALFSGHSGQQRECDHSQESLFWVLICEPKREIENLKVPMPILPAGRAHLRVVHTEEKEKAERHWWHLGVSMVGWVPRRILRIPSHTERYCSWEIYKEWLINGELDRNSQPKSSYSPSSSWIWINPFQSYSGQLSKIGLSSEAKT